MKRTNKKGFTIVELVIVIAVIAILAAVLIPTFSNLIQKAQEAKDTANVRSLNQALRADTNLTKHKTMHEAVAAAQRNGIDVTRLTASVPGNVILWDSENDLFAYYKVGEKGETGEISYIPEFKPAGKLSEAYKFWKVSRDVADFKGTYSIYWSGEDMPTADVTVGFDAGDAKIEQLNYIRTTGDKQSVIIRTNGGSLTVNAPSDTVAHYGKANKVDIVAVERASYHEYGQVGYMQVASGRVVVESTSEVKVGAVLVVKPQEGNTNQGVRLEVNKSGVEIAKEDGVTPEVVVNGTTKTDIAVSNKDELETKYGIFANGDGSKANPYQIATAEDLTNLANFTNNGKLTGKCYVLTGDIDLQGKAFTPIGTAENPFKGIFDGKGYTIRNFAINWSDDKNGAGLFGFAEGTPNAAYKELSDVWTAEKSQFSESKIAQENYDTVIENVNIAGLTMTTTSTGRYGGAVVGIAKNIYIVNCRVSETAIVGFKGIGGVVGSLDGSIVKNCSTNSDVSVKSISAGYNIGGIVGATSYTNSGLSSAIINCDNYASVRMDTTANDGYIGGIVGMAQNGHCDVIVGCKNYGELYAKTNGDSENGPDIAGIAGQCHSVKLIYDCTNSGNITVADDFMGVVAGIGGYTGAKIELNNCVNTVSITVHAKQLAGLMGGIVDGNYLTCTNSSNSGTLKNKNENGVVAEIYADKKTYSIDGEFKNVAALNERISSATTYTIIVLKNVTVKNTSDTALVIPANIIQFTADTKVADKMIYTGASKGLGIFAKGLEVAVRGENLKSLTVDGENNKVVVEKDTSIDRMTVKGSATIEVAGNVTGELYLGGEMNVEATILENGFVDSIRFSGTGTYTLTNKGLISHSTETKYRNQHTIYALSECNVTINNYGKIEATGTNPSYTLLFYGNSTVVFNAYNGSEVSNTCEQGYLLACHLSKGVTFNVYQGAKLTQNGNDVGYDKLKNYQCVTVVNK